MDPSSIPCIASGGIVLSVHEKAALQSSLPIVKKNNKFSEVLFFGKMQAATTDYLIAIGIKDSFLDEKKFFFCTDGASWAQLPTPTPEMIATCEQLPKGLMLTGNEAHVYQLPAPPPPETEEEEAPAEEVEGPKVSETERLAVIVEMIEKETALAPKAALSMRSAGAVQRNPGFSGLSMAEAGLLSNYVFLNKMKASSVLDAPMSKSVDALLSAETIVPKAALSIHMDESIGATTVRNLLYPGAVAFTMPGSTTWGYCYFGSGEKNGDIAFMLP